MLDIKFKIQIFADGGEGGDGQQEQQTPATTENNETPDTGEKKSENKTSDVDIDAKIAEALSKAQKNFEDTLKKRDAAAKKEAELSKLSDAERQKAEIENGRKELELKEKELQRKELMLEMTKVLAERNLPVEFTEYLIAENSESTLERIKTFEKKYKAAIEVAVNERLKGKAPQSGNKNPSENKPRVKDDFMNTILANQAKRG